MSHPHRRGERLTLRTRLERWRAPGYGTCYRCGRPWKYADKHITNIEGQNGCFALCEPCWQSLTPEQRIPYYAYLWEDWAISAPGMRTDWEPLSLAVLGGA